MTIGLLGRQHSRVTQSKSRDPSVEVFRNAVVGLEDEYASAEEIDTFDGDVTARSGSLGDVQHSREVLTEEIQEWRDRAHCFEAILETRTRECHELMEVCEQYEEEKELLVLNVSCQVNGACAMKFIGLKVTLGRLFWGLTLWRLAMAEPRIQKAQREAAFAVSERDAAVATERRESR